MLNQKARKSPASIPLAQLRLGADESRRRVNHESSRLLRAVVRHIVVICFGCLLASLATNCVQAQERSSDETGVAGANIDYQPGELVEVSLFDKWVPGRMMQKVGEGQFRVKIQTDGRRREVSLDSSKIRRIGPEAIIPLTELRQWSDLSGKHKIEARLTKIGEDDATLLKTDGSKVSVPITKLSNLDQQLIRRLARARRKREQGTDGESIASSDADSQEDGERTARGGREGRRPPPPGMERGGREEAGDLEGDPEGSPSAGQAGPPSSLVAVADPLAVGGDVESRERIAPPGPEGNSEPTLTEAPADPNLVRMDPTGMEPLLLSPPETPLIAIGSLGSAQTVSSAIELSSPQAGAPTSIAGMAIAESAATMLVAMSTGGPGANLIYGIHLKSGSELFQLPLGSAHTLFDVSPDGNRFATLVLRADGVSAIAIWEITEGTPKRMVDLAFSDDRGVQFVRFRSPEGLVVVTDTSVFGIDFSNENATIRYQLDTVVSAIAAAPDRSGMALIADGSIFLIASDSGNVMANLTVDGFNPQGIAIRSDATRLAAVGNTQVQVWDLTTGSPLSSVDLPQPVRGGEIVFVNDSEVLVTQNMLTSVEEGTFSGNYQLETPHEPNALRSMGGFLWYGFVDPAGGSVRLIPVNLPVEGAAGGADQVHVLGGNAGEPNAAGHDAAGANPDEQGLTDPDEESGREPNHRPGHGPGK